MREDNFFGVVLSGVLRKSGRKTWFFGGENVVGCVVNVVNLRTLLRREKQDTHFNFIFAVPVFGYSIIPVGVPTSRVFKFVFSQEKRYSSEFKWG